MTDGNASILIVDDRPEKLLALEAVLEDLGPAIVRAYSGRDALRQVLAQDFAVILLDVNMPGMDGFETASLIRQRKSSAHVPIIFITAFGDEMHETRGYELGAVDYILAPVVPDVLRTKVSVFVDLFRKSQQLRRQADWLRAQAEQLHKVTAASLAINSAISVDEMLRVVNDTARQIIGAHQAGAVAVLGPGRNRVLRVASFSDKFAGAQTCCPLMESTDAWRSVQQSGAPLRLTQAEVERIAIWSEPPDPMRIGLPPPAVAPVAPPMRGWLAAPLTSRDGQNIGVVQLSDRYEGDFTNDDEAILVQLAQMASIALENSLYAEEREANRIKDEFLATLSHELRTPLNAILGWTQLLRADAGSRAASDAAEVAHGLEVIERNARSQAKLIEDLLDVSRITTGKMRLHVKPTEIGKVVLAAADVVRPAAEAKHIAIDCRLDDEASNAMIAADPDRLQQVFWNLFSNAVKFTPPGGKITCALARDEEADEVVLRIADTGAGIDPKFLPCVFDRFRQADSSSTRSQGGLGIGLTIVRHIVELHGGTVRAESAGEGSGSTFTVTLPLAAPAPAESNSLSPSATAVRLPAAAPAPRAADLRGVKVLVVDDDADAREVLRQMLTRAGIDVVTAASAAEAFVLLDERRPHVLLSDIAMPDEDGYSLMRRVRRLAPESGGAIPAVALSAYARDEDRRQSLAAGFQAHLAKPVEPHELLSTLARWAGDFTDDDKDANALRVAAK